MPAQITLEHKVDLRHRPQRRGTDRQFAAAFLYQLGLTQAEIGRRLGITRNGAADLLRRSKPCQ